MQQKWIFFTYKRAINRHMLDLFLLISCSKNNNTTWKQKAKIFKSPYSFSSAAVFSSDKNSCLDLNIFLLVQYFVIIFFTNSSCYCLLPFVLRVRTSLTQLFLLFSSWMPTMFLCFLNKCQTKSLLEKQLSNGKYKFEIDDGRCHFNFAKIHLS